MKYEFFSYLVVITLLSSCTKNKIESIRDPSTPSGAINGNIKAYNKYGNENSNYNDVAVELIDKKGRVFNGLANGNGTFRFENVLLGDITLAISKPGYGFIDSVKYNHQRGSDTLTDISLIEELPFSYQIARVSYFDSTFSYSGNCSYQSTDSFMVSTYFCFSKVPEVSIKNTLLLLNTGLQYNVAYLTGGLDGKFRFLFKSFIDAGFKEGDQIYVTAIPSILKFGTSYFTKNRNYEVLHYKVRNTSNILSFTSSQ